jgi:nucleotide-binding universal stress UspA family protein
VTVVHVTPLPAPAATAPGPGSDPLARAARILQEVAGDAHRLAVPCEGKVLFGTEPWRAIVQAAADHEVDLVCMGAHGRHRAAEQVLASQSARVIEHTRIPVLLFH